MTTAQATDLVVAACQGWAEAMRKRAARCEREAEHQTTALAALLEGRAQAMRHHAARVEQALQVLGVASGADSMRRSAALRANHVGHAQLQRPRAAVPQGPVQHLPRDSAPMGMCAARTEGGALCRQVARHRLAQGRQQAEVCGVHARQAERLGRLDLVLLGGRP